LKPHWRPAKPLQEINEKKIIYEGLTFVANAALVETILFNIQVGVLIK
jgi:hypothetical protein